MPTPLSLFIEKNPEYTIARIARDTRRDKGHVSRIATGLISPRPETRLALEIATNGGVPASAWAEPGPRIRRDLPSYSFRFVKEGDPVLCCALNGAAEKTQWWGPCWVERVNARNFSLREVSGFSLSKLNGWASKGAPAWAIPLAATSTDMLLLDGANGLPRPAQGCESPNPVTGILAQHGLVVAGHPPARLVPANWPHLAAYVRNRRLPFNV